MKISKSQRNNILFFLFILIMIIPQTRTPLQVLVHKGLAQFAPSVIADEKREILSDYSWILADDSGEQFDFESAKGRVVVLNFWATWCPPCVAEMPSIAQLYASYKDEVLFLLVTDEKDEIIARFKERHGYTFPVFRPLTALPKGLEARSIPKTYVIGKDGSIAINKTGAADWDSDKVQKTLQSLLGQNQ
ncbi:MAG TPA: TlpA disulfide reductase family protein [Aquaticitalea sp.]|nr:TlpA disulfide reductase family protein [Aquaticitalea sp.]